jgi:hypothetical protein
MVSTFLSGSMEFYKLKDEKKVKKIMSECIASLMACDTLTDVVEDLFPELKPEDKFKILFCFAEMQRNLSRQKEEALANAQ